MATFKSRKKKISSIQSMRSDKNGYSFQKMKKSHTARNETAARITTTMKIVIMPANNGIEPIPELHDNVKVSFSMNKQSQKVKMHFNQTRNLLIETARTKR